MRKNIPVIEGNKVKPDSINHPITDEHYIEGVEVSNGLVIYKVFLKPGQESSAEFAFQLTNARAYCNLHRLWEI